MPVADPTGLPETSPQLVSEKPPRLLSVYILILVAAGALIFGSSGYYLGRKSFSSSLPAATSAPQPPQIYRDQLVSFNYPAGWVAQPQQSQGSGYTQEFFDPLGKYSLSFSTHGNYNQTTGQPYIDIDEYAGMPYQTRSITVDGLPGRQTLPRAGSENTNSVVFFSPDTQNIYTLTLYTNNSSPDGISLSQQLFSEILSGFHFQTVPTPGDVLQTARVIVQDGSYYGPPFDSDLYQLEISPSEHLFAKSQTVNLKQYMGQTVKITYRDVPGVIMGEQQLVTVESVQK